MSVDILTLKPSDFPIGIDRAQIEAAYGDPDPYLRDGDDSDWRAEILTREKVLFQSPVRYSGTRTMLSGQYVHKRLAEHFRAIFRDLAEANLWRHVSDCAGVYAFRLQRGGSRLSLHSWAAAIDLNADIYPLAAPPDWKDPFVRLVVPVFQAHGFQWGGLWGRPDVGHFEATRRLT